MVLVGAVLFSAPAMAADPQLTHQASGSGFPIPAPVFDFATLAGGDNPTGTITFTAFGPDDPTCAGGAVFTSTKTVTGNGNYQSDNFNPNEAGLYRFIAAYSGDPNNTAVSTVCSDPAGEVFAPKAIPQFSTQASLLSVGGQITDTATLDGAGPAGPTGTITFNLYGPTTSRASPPPSSPPRSPSTATANTSRTRSRPPSAGRTSGGRPTAATPTTTPSARSAPTWRSPSSWS